MKKFQITITTSTIFQTMAASLSRKIHFLYFCIILFHSLKPNCTDAIYFKMIAGTNEEKSVGDIVSLINKEFFQCGRQQSCTHVMKISTGYMTVHGSEDLETRKHQALCVYEKMHIPARSCLDFYNVGARVNGQYEIFDQNDAPYKVFCDFESETNSIWTLVSSYSLKNNDALAVAFFKNNPRNEMNPNWKDYRLGLARMKHTRSSTAMWRATCSFPTYKSDVYRDYMRVNFNEADILEIKCLECCYTMDYINIRGHRGLAIKGALWQGEEIALHVDSSKHSCKFDARKGSVQDEDNFGHYRTINQAFRCTESVESTTQYWFGVNV